MGRAVGIDLGTTNSVIAAMTRRPVRRANGSRVPPFGLTRAFACCIARRLTSLILSDR
jgi:molecular chaperone DnaK (HSP70)